MGRWDEDGGVSLAKSFRANASGISKIAVERRRGRLVVVAGRDGSLSIFDLRVLGDGPLSEAASTQEWDQDEGGYSKQPLKNPQRNSGALALRDVIGCSEPKTALMSFAGQIDGATSIQGPCVGSGHSDQIDGLAWLPDDDRLFASGGDDGLLKIWDAAGARAQQLPSVLSLALHSPVHAVGINDARGVAPRVAAALNDNTVRLVDLRSGRATNTLQGHTRPPLCVTWGEAAEDRLYSAGMDGTIRAWDVRMGARSLFCFDPYAHNPAIQSSLKRTNQSASERSRLIGAFSGGAAARATSEWEYQQEAKLTPYRFQSMKKAFNSDCGAIRGSNRPMGTGTAFSLASADRPEQPSRLQSQQDQEAQEQWLQENAARKRHWEEPPVREYFHQASTAHRGAVVSLAFCSAETGGYAQLLSCGVDGKVRSWNPTTGALVQPLESRPVKRKLEGGVLTMPKREEAANLWKPAFDVECWMQEKPLQLGVVGHPEDFCLVPEHDQVAVYCLLRGRLLCRLAAHTAPVVCVEALGPHRSEILTAGADGRLLCWHAGTSHATKAETIELDD